MTSSKAREEFSKTNLASNPLISGWRRGASSKDQEPRREKQGWRKVTACSLAQSCNGRGLTLRIRWVYLKKVCVPRTVLPRVQISPQRDQRRVCVPRNVVPQISPQLPRSSLTLQFLSRPLLPKGLERSGGSPEIKPGPKRRLWGIRGGGARLTKGSPWVSGPASGRRGAPGSSRESLCGVRAPTPAAPDLVRSFSPGWAFQSRLCACARRRGTVGLHLGTTGRG